MNAAIGKTEIATKKSIIDEIIADESVEFGYKQGLNSASGTNLAIDALFRNSSIDIPGVIQDLEINEQWLFTDGEFGKLGNRKVWEIIRESVPNKTQFGDAIISDKHANFFINKDNASYAFIIGEDELKSENIIVKSLNDENSEQIIMNISEIENFIQNIK